MSRYNHHQSAFKNGMVSSKLLGRTDIEEYASSAREMLNMLPAPMGGTFSRPGTVNQLKVANNSTVIPWERSDGNYFLVFTPIAFPNNTNQTAFSLYDSNWLPKAIFTSNVALVNRDGSSTDLITQYQLIYNQTNSGAYFATIDPQGFTAVTLENNLVLAHNSGLIPPLVFYIDSVGIGRIEHYQFSGKLPCRGPHLEQYYTANDTDFGFQSTPYTFNKDNTFFLPFIAAGVTTPGAYTTTYVTGTLTAFEGDTATTKNYFTADMLHTYVVINQLDTEGIYLIVGINSPSEARIAVIMYGKDNVTKSRNFRRQLFCKEFGFPKIISTFNGRLIFANTHEKPNWFWCSRTNYYREISSFRPFQLLEGDPITEADSFELPLSSRNFSEIKWISQQNDLLIGTGKEEFVVSQGEGALSIFNIGIAPQSSIGGSFVPAVKNSEAVFFVSADGKTIRQIQYNFDVRGYRSKNISILNDDLVYRLRPNQTEDSIASIKIVKLAWQESNRVLWILTNIGNVLAVTIEPASETRAWSFHVFGANENIKDIFTYFSETMERSLYGMVSTNRNAGYYIDIMAPEYLNKSLIVDSLNIGDQPIFMDGSAIMVPDTSGFSAVFAMVQSLGTGILIPPLANYGDGWHRQLPTGKKMTVTAVDVPDATIFVGAQVYIINEYAGFGGGPSLFLATSLANALVGTKYLPAADKSITLQDAEPTAKYTKWGSFVNYIGKTLDVIGDGVLYEGKTVDAHGIITLPVAVSRIVAGFFFPGELETITPDYGGSFGSAQGSMKRVDRAFVRYHRSFAGQIGSEDSNLESIVFPGDLPYSGTITHVNMGSPDVEYRLILKKNKSLPLNVMSVTLRGQVNE